MDTNILLKLLEDQADSTKVPAMEAYMKNKFSFLGVQKPILKKIGPEDFPKLKELAQTKSWWDSIDQLDLIIGEVTFHYPETKNIMRQWSLDEDFWLRRIAIDHQLMRKDLTDTALLAEVICNNFGQTEFFINKAIGWSLRNYSKVNPDWVRAFIDQHASQMASLSIREASKYL